MALDTKTKRASVPGVGRPWYRTKQPAANSVTWRWASGNTYAVNATTTATPITTHFVTLLGQSNVSSTLIGQTQRNETILGQTQKSNDLIGSN